MASLLIALAAGAVIGLCLGALGGGGSILTVPVLVSLLHMDPHAATCAALIIVGLSALTATIGHARAGHVDWKAAAIFGVVASVTAVGGSIANRAADPDLLMVALSVVMLLAAGAMLYRTRRTAAEPDVAEPSGGQQGSGGTTTLTRTGNRTRAAARIARVLAVELVVGFLTGFLGVGGGFLIVPALVLALGFSMPVAVGTSLVIIVITTAGAFAERIGSITVDWHVVLPFTVAAIAASFFGTRISERISPTALTRGFAIALIAVAAFVAADTVFALPM
ncbi:sulfite exporter TauE/SafE family protein [Mycolicibacterium cosmeticum]|uniref:Probable membrane transporter protein n=1 Tax=Mycolicibacterium cosmeticum TaxID=258533 RepID=W9B6V9_MYCCO|nr:sulfite exporter TauE/SafE family protein [Mycolicibacterium cosmeticum]TLH81440.1 sulfite exporter TauE/SafE family protein [Mycolicibacterium cosmeticum]CDO10451.1 putative permease [Mycolicibacterium cosmeticum]